MCVKELVLEQPTTAVNNEPLFLLGVGLGREQGRVRKHAYSLSIDKSVFLSSSKSLIKY